jgi:hypothetical protein
MSKWPDSCCIYGKSFRGWEPLTDGNGHYFHRKCFPKLDVEGMKKAVSDFFGEVEKPIAPKN